MEELRSHAVGDDDAVDRLGGGGGPPADDGDATAPGRQDVPQRLHAALGHPGRGLAPRGQIHHEVEDPVILGATARGDGRPQDGRDERRRGPHHAGAPALTQTSERRKPAGGRERLDGLPVGAVQADEDHGPRGFRRRGGRVPPPGQGDDDHRAREVEREREEPLETPRSGRHGHGWTIIAVASPSLQGASHSRSRHRQANTRGALRRGPRPGRRHGSGAGIVAASARRRGRASRGPRPRSGSRRGAGGGWPGRRPRARPGRRRPASAPACPRCRRRSS